MKKIIALISAFLLMSPSMPNLQVSAEEIKGDINSDGKFDIADVVSLQKWLLTESDAKLADWQAGDLYEDNKINVLDLCRMKFELIK